MKILNIRVGLRNVLAEIGGVPDGEEAAEDLAASLFHVGLPADLVGGLATVGAVRVNIPVHAATGMEKVDLAFSVVIGAMALWGARLGLAVRVDEDRAMDEGWQLCEEDGVLIWRPDP